MPRLYILIDSSTLPTSDTNAYGISTVCWCAFKNKMQGSPCHAGVIYRDKYGPRKIFIEGVIRALQDCKYLFQIYNTVEIKGDDLTVINILNGDNKAHVLNQYYEQANKIERDCEKKYGAKFNHEYIGEINTLYKAVDKISKKLRTYISELFTQ